MTVSNETNLQKLLIIAEDANIDDRVRAGACLLLGNQTAAKIHFNKLDAETQQTFKKWPIYRYWKDN